MIDIVSIVATKCGISPEMARMGIGILLGFMKKNVSPEVFGQLSAAVPGADAMIASAPAGKEASGGLLGTVTGMAGKLFGGSDAAGGVEVASQLSQAGFTPDQVGKFLPTAMEQLQGNLPGDIMSKFGDLMPTVKA